MCLTTPPQLLDLCNIWSALFFRVEAYDISALSVSHQRHFFHFNRTFSFSFNTNLPLVDYHSSRLRVAIFLLLRL